ncbi:DnaJ molecular chaperone homology domain [Rhizoctonia solani]|uniref:DnaJ molecular chaperone homology domain n=1 Tax=Rhizoctonia solani TaxID=456999 RepID=A0A8H7LYV7_9AGAM|nr:DnaJ molecular chaperone homology domain [Rhizoctonia solani]
MGAQNSRAGPGGATNGEAVAEISYYELLGVEEDATADEIKVLSDEQERAWYDSHRASMGPTLGGEDIFEDIVSNNGKPFKARPRDPGMTTPQLFHFFDATLATSMDDSKYASVISLSATSRLSKRGSHRDFSRYTASTLRSETRIPLGLPPPNKKGTRHYTQACFTEHGLHFLPQDFSWYDSWNIAEAPDRRVRRLMERDNKKARDDAKKEYNETVKTLALFLRKRDPRFKAHKDTQAKVIPTNSSKPKWQRSRSNAEDHVDLEWGLAEGDDEEYECVVCGKSFQSEAGWLSHERSKKHMKEVEKLKRQMQEENIELGLDDEQDAIESDEAVTPDNNTGPIPSDDNELQAPSASTKKSKKKKKKAKGLAIDPELTEAEAPRDELAEAMQGLKVETHGDNENENEEGGAHNEGDKPTLTKREKRRAKEAAKKAQEAEASSAPQVCNVCTESFESRSKLFAHIEEEGHQLAAPDKGTNSQNKKSGAKKGKGKELPLYTQTHCEPRKTIIHDARPDVAAPTLSWGNSTGWSKLSHMSLYANTNHLFQVRGQIKSVSGTFQRAVGSLVRAHGFAGRGRDRHNRGVAEVQAAKAKGYASGTSDRVRGRGHSILGGITGNRRRQARGNALSDKGNLKQAFHSGNRA